MSAGRDPFQELEQLSETAMRVAQDVSRTQQEAVFQAAGQVSRAQIDMLRQAAKQMQSAAEAYMKAYQDAMNPGKGSGKSQ